MLGTYITMKQGLSTVAKILGKIDDAADGTLEISKSEALLFSAKGSMIKMLSTFIIEPTIIISKDLREEEITEKLAEINLDVFASFYMQAFNVMVNVYGMDQQTAFDVLSSKSGLPPSAQYATNSFEGMDALSLEGIKILPISMESKNHNHSKVQRASINEGKGLIIPSLMQKTIDITLSVKNSSDKTVDIVIPVLIKATVIYSGFSDIEVMVNANGKDKRFLNRLDEYRAGLVSIGDMIFADDLVKEYKKNRFKDKDDLILYMETRASDANKKLLTNGAVGFSKFYGVLIVNKRQMSILENKLGGKISKPKYKEMLMDQTKSLLINVVDTDWERVSMYTKDIQGTSDMSYKIIKKRKGDSNSSELAEVFKALTSNKPPVF